MACVTHDPRWDRQIESRSDYYAALMIHAALPLDALAAHLRAPTAPDADDPNDLVLSTVCTMAERGYAPAVAIARDYLTYGPCWEMAFEALVTGPLVAIAVDEVSQILDRRFPEDEVLDGELPTTGPGMHTQQEPWRSLRVVNPRVERILSAHESAAVQQQFRQEQLRTALSGRSMPDLLAAPVDDTTARFAARCLQQQVTTADLDLLLRVAQQGDRWQRFVAFRGLQYLAHPAAFPILRAFFEGSEVQSGFLYGAAVQALEALPAHVTLDLARDWFDAPDGLHRHVALQILDAHATSDDIPRVRAALIPSLQRDTGETTECYMQCTMLEILARFPAGGPYPEAETIFKEAGYARTRMYAAHVLAASDRDRFSGGLAVECLWDCEEEVRQRGCAYADLNNPAALSRLQSLAGDPFEDEVVRTAAHVRLEQHG